MASNSFPTKITSSVTAMLAKEEKELTALARTGVRLMKLGRHIWRETVRDDCLSMAAALSFTTVLSLVPLVAVFFLVVNALGFIEGLKEEVQRFFVENFLVETAPSQGIETATSQEAQEAAISTSDKIVEFANNVVGFLDNPESVWMGVFGFAFLILTCIALLSTIEGALNKIWGSAKSRTLLRRVTTYWTAITLGPALLVLSVYVGQVFLKGKVEQVTWLSGAFQTLFGYALPFAMAFAALLALYILLPNVRVNVRSAALGAIVAAFLWEIGKRAFGYYVATVPTYSAIYGGMGTLPIFLLWVYLSWIFFLFGAEVAYVAQNLDRFEQEARKAQAKLKVVQAPRDLLAVAIMALIGDRFLSAKPAPSTEELGREVDLSSAVLDSILNPLAEAGLIERVQSDSTSYRPARPPDLIPVKEVLALFRGPGARPSLDGDSLGAPMTALFDKLDAHYLAGGEGVTISDLVSGKGSDG